MGFFKSINNFAKSAMGDTKAMIEQGHWMMKNGQIDAGINCFSGAAIKGDQEAMVLWGNALIEHGNADVDTLGGLIFYFQKSIPEVGKEIRQSNGLVFKIIDADMRRIKKIRVSGFPKV